MVHSTSSASSVERPAEAGSEPPDDGRAILTALGDADCRAILEAAADGPRSAAELAAACELPLSTTYRKLRRLEEAGLVDERARVDGERNHPGEFETALSSCRLRLAPDGGLGLTVAFADDRDPVSVPVPE